MADQNPEEMFQSWLLAQGSDYTGKGKKQQWWDNYHQNLADVDTGKQNAVRWDNYLDPSKQSQISISGTANEIEGKTQGLERAKMLTGQNTQQIGQEYQQAYGNIKKRSESSDTGSELLRANKAGAVADARNQMQQQGVKGGAALGAVSQIERAKSYDVNNQLQQAQQKSEADYLNATKANANFTQQSEMNYGALAAGKDVKPSSPGSSGFGGFGTVICTELYEKGYLSEEVWQRDVSFGVFVRKTRPELYLGYRLLADPIVKLMKKSKIFTSMVAFFAVPWALDMSGEPRLLGHLVNIFGQPLCYFVGKHFCKGALHDVR